MKNSAARGMIEATRSLDWKRIEQLRESGAVPDDELLSPDRVIGRGNGCTVIYGPFDGPPVKSARLMIIGLTPGYGQLRLANDVLREANEDQITDVAVIGTLRRERAAFAGSMRTNMVAMLDRIDLSTHLGLASTADLFSSRSNLAFTTSALRYPVFVGETFTNFGGATRMMERLLFQEMVTALLSPEVESMPNALLLPLGIAAQNALLWLAQHRSLDPDRIVRGFPHPSGANGHRARIFELNESDLRSQIESWFSRR